LDTKEIRRAYNGRVFDAELVRDVGELCDEVDRLRAENAKLTLAKLDANVKAHRLEMELADAKNDIARLREKAGEKVCSVCKEPRQCLHEVHIDVRGRNAKDIFEGVCGKCADRALDALRGGK